MSHVVMQAAEFPSVELARAAELELDELVEAQTAFEKSAPDPWGWKRVSPHLAAFGEKHGVPWPHDEKSRFLLKGSFEDEANVLRAGRLLFFWGPGFDLGGDTLRAILTKLGATKAVGEGNCHVVIKHDAPAARAKELADELEEDFEEQFTLVEDAGPEAKAWFTLTIEGPKGRARLEFDDSGVQDWAFTSVLSSLRKADPTLG